MIVTTTPEVPGKTVVEYKGIVFGEEISVRTAVGFNVQKNLDELKNMLMRTKYGALNHLIYKASQMGANAVIGMSFTVDHEAGSICVSATGTAVVVEG